MTISQPLWSIREGWVLKEALLTLLIDEFSCSTCQPNIQEILMQPELSTQLHPGNVLISVSQVKPEEGGVWVTLGMDSRGQFNIWIPSKQVASPSFHVLFWLMEFVSDWSSSWNCRWSEQGGRKEERTGHWSEQLHHTLWWPSASCLDFWCISRC